MQVNSTVAKAFQCEVCTETMHPPIRICIYGHSFCDWCSKKARNCPMCKQPKEDGRNYALERVHDKFTLPCTYNLEGCNVTMLGSKIHEHEKFCDYMTIPCPLNPILSRCPWNGHVKDVHVHCTEHGLDTNNVTSNNGRQVRGFKILLDTRSGFKQIDTHCMLFEVHEEIFKCVFETNFNTGIMRWKVIFLGPRMDARKYQFEIVFQNKQKGLKKIVLSMACQPLQTSLYEEDKYVQSHASVLKKYCDNGELRCIIAINKANEERPICASNRYRKLNSELECN